MMQHLALIMDGNRRWAKQRGLLPWIGHQEGAKVIEHVVNFCLQQGIRYVSLYTFSLENKKRPEAEVRFLFDLLVNEAMSMIQSCTEKNIRVRFIGDRHQYPDYVRTAVERLENATKECSALQLNFLFFYGAQQEIIWTVKELARKLAYGELKEEELTNEVFEQCLWTYGLPQPDLIIRTGGHNRLSNFLLYQAAYSEIMFLDDLWPDITPAHLQTCITKFYDAQRNFGV